MSVAFKRAAVALGVVVNIMYASGAAAAADQSLYEALGGGPGVAKLVDVFADHLFADAQIAPFFTASDPVEVRRRLTAQFCDLSGGPCKTINPDMKKTHQVADIKASDFDSVLRLLTLSMNERGVPAEVQAKLLEKLRPMKSDIVNAPD